MFSQEEDLRWEEGNTDRIRNEERERSFIFWNVVRLGRQDKEFWDFVVDHEKSCLSMFR